MSLNGDLVRQAQRLTPNLSETVERLLADFVERAPTPEIRRQQEVDRHIDASNMFVAEHGTLADDFPTL